MEVIWTLVMPACAVRGQPTVANARTTAITQGTSERGGAFIRLTDSQTLTTRNMSVFLVVCSWNVPFDFFLACGSARQSMLLHPRIIRGNKKRTLAQKRCRMS